MATYKTIWEFKCGICGKQEQGVDIYDKWAELKYGKLSTFAGRENKIDICPDCLNKILKGENK
jgi:hypothetical protein